MTIFLEIVKQILVEGIKEINLELQKAEPTTPSPSPTTTHLSSTPPSLLAVPATKLSQTQCDLLVQQIKASTSESIDEKSQETFKDLILASQAEAGQKGYSYKEVFKLGTDNLLTLLRDVYIKLKEVHLIDVAYNPSDAYCIFQYHMAKYLTKHIREEHERLHVGGVGNLFKGVAQSPYFSNSRELTAAKEALVLKALRECELSLRTMTRAAEQYSAVYKMIVMKELELLQVNNQRLVIQYSRPGVAAVTRVATSMFSMFSGQTDEKEAAPEYGFLEECILAALRDIAALSAPTVVSAPAVDDKSASPALEDARPVP